MLPVATVDCAPAGSSANVVKLIHRIKANQNLELLILFLLTVMAQTVTGRGITKRRESTSATIKGKMVSDNHVRVSAKHERCHIQKLVTAKKQGTKLTLGT